MRGACRHGPFKAPRRVYDSIAQTHEDLSPAHGDTSDFRALYKPSMAFAAESLLATPSDGGGMRAGSRYHINSRAASPPAAVVREFRHAYYASVTWVDEQFGRVVDELDALGMRQSTLVVVHSDHGHRSEPRTRRAHSSPRGRWTVHH